MVANVLPVGATAACERAVANGARGNLSTKTGQMLSELYAKGTLAPPADEKATFTSLAPWLR